MVMIQFLPRTLTIEPYLVQRQRWPASGEHLLAHHDATSIVVYQAYRPSIGSHSASHGRLGGDGFSLGRMSWIKPSFLWMMFRSGWATKEGQEVVLALHLARAGFDEILASAVPSTWDRARYAERAEWERAVAASDVRVQWDPDHTPGGHKVERRTIQLGLRGGALRRLVEEWTLAIEDVTPFVAAQRAYARAPYDQLWTPVEHPYSMVRAGDC